MLKTTKLYSKPTAMKNGKAPNPQFKKRRINEQCCEGNRELNSLTIQPGTYLTVRLQLILESQLLKITDLETLTQW